MGTKGEFVSAPITAVVPEVKAIYDKIATLPDKNRQVRKVVCILFLNLRGSEKNLEG